MTAAGRAVAGLLLLLELGTPPATAAAAPPRPRSRGPLLVGGGVLAAATVLDVETTFAALARCGGCREANLFLRGSVESGRAWSYGTQAALGGGALYLAHRLRRSPHPRTRRAWWVPLATLTAVHVLAAVANARQERPKGR